MARVKTFARNEDMAKVRYYFNDLKHSTRPWKKVVLFLGFAAVGAYLAFMGAYFATSQPSFCGVCHEVKPYVDSWKQSPHKQVSCLYCHEKRGFIGKLDSKTRGLNYLYQQITGQYTIFTQGKIFEPNCIDCHLGNYRNYPNAKQLNIKHYEFLKTDRSCLECHRETGHKVNIFSTEKFAK